MRFKIYFCSFKLSLRLLPEKKMYGYFIDLCLPRPGMASTRKCDQLVRDFFCNARVNWLKTLYTVMAALRGNKLFWSGAMNKLSTYCEQSSANLICFLIKMISSCQYATSFSLRNFTSSFVFETNYHTLTYDSQNLRKSQCYYCGM